MADYLQEKIEEMNNLMIGLDENQAKMQVKYERWKIKAKELKLKNEKLIMENE